MIIVIVLLSILGRHFCQDIEDNCIRNGQKILNGSTIHDGLLKDNICAFLMIGNPFVVLQPYNLQINKHVVIKLYSIERNGNSITKQLITKYDGKFPYNNLIFMAQTTKEFALVIVKNEITSVGTFLFKFRTNCYTEVILEAYPIFSSPNLLFGNDSNKDYTCQYDIFSTSGTTYSANLIYFELNKSLFTVNGVKVVMYSRLYPFFARNAKGKTTVIYKNVPDIPYTYHGFNASVQPIISESRFVNLDKSHSTGDIQVKFDNQWYYIQTLSSDNTLAQLFSLSLYDKHFMCTGLGFLTVQELNSKVLTSTKDRYLLHRFNCQGQHSNINECAPLTMSNLQYLNQYAVPPRVVRLTCAAKLQFKLSEGDFGYIQSSIQGKWVEICSDTLDKQLANNLCKNLGYSSAGVILQKQRNSYELLKAKSLGCANKTKIDECPFRVYQIPYCLGLWITCLRNDQLTLVGGANDNEGYINRNKVFACADNFNNETALKVCQNIGYPKYKSFSSDGSLNTSGHSIHPVECKTSLNGNVACSFDSQTPCQSKKVATVVCQNVALAGINSSNEGRVEVYYGGKNGLLCSDTMTMKNGDVICKQLGFKNAISISKEASTVYGSGNRLMFLNGLNCIGNESSINQCAHNAWLTGYCNSKFVTGLVCNGGTTSCGLNFVTYINIATDSGARAVNNQYPWHVYVYTDTEPITRCSGIIINLKWVLTSASCIKESKDKYYFEVSKFSINYDGIKFKVGKVIIHPNYSPEDNNIALLGIDQSLVFSESVQPACLPPLNGTLQDLNCVTTGWNQGDEYQDQFLMDKRIVIQSPDDCLKSTQFSADKIKRYLCSSNNLAQKPVFNGESGGPLTCLYNGRSTLVGINDRIINGVGATNLNLFTNVEYYLGWIQDILSDKN